MTKRRKNARSKKKSGALKQLRKQALQLETVNQEENVEFICVCFVPGRNKKNRAFDLQVYGSGIMLENYNAEKHLLEGVDVRRQKRHSQPQQPQRYITPITPSKLSIGPGSGETLAAAGRSLGGKAVKRKIIVSPGMP